MANYKQSSIRNITLYLTSIRGEGKFMKFHFLSEYAVEQVRKIEHLFREKTDELEVSTSFQTSYQIPRGSQFCVKSRIKQQWCRACVLPVDVGLQQVAVSLIDYGNREVVPVADVRSGGSLLPTCGPLATECILADVAPAHGEEWSPDAIKFCEQHLLFQDLSGYIVTEFQGIPVVRVAKLGETEPFVQRMIDSCLAKIEAIEAPTKIDIFSGPGFKLLPLELNTNHLVTVSCVFTPRLFYVQLSPVEVELKNLMESIERCVNFDPLDFVNTPMLGLPCLAQHNRHYYRAVIKDVQQGVCKVMLVDYGNTLNKDIRELRAIPVHFLSLPAQAICCTLRDAQMLSTEDFIKITKVYRYLTCRVVGTRSEAYIVNLLNNGVNILPSTKSEQQPLFVIQPLTVNTTLDVTTTYVSSHQEFYCQLTSCKKDLDIITHKLESANDFEMLKVRDVIPGLATCAKFSEDGLWYRTKVLSVQDANNIEVFFVDYGNTEKVKLHDIRMIPSNLLLHPVHAYKFMLHGFSEINVSNDISEWFEDIILESALRAEIKSANENAYSVILYMENSRESINEKLKEKLNSTLFVELSNPEVLFVTNFDPPAIFFGQMARFHQDALEQLQVEVNSHCCYYVQCSQPEVAPKFNIGDLVCAKFSEDDQYYRARVESSNDSGCNVFFVDYGNRSFVLLKDIQEIDQRFITHPFFGVECIIDKCPPGVNTDQLASALLEHEVQIRPVKTVSPGKLQVAFTESFPGNSAVLSVLKQYSIMNDSEIPRSLAPAKNSSSRLNNSEKNEFKSGQISMKPDVQKTEVNAQNHNKNFTFEEQLQSDILNQNLEDYDKITIPDGCFKEIYVSYVKSPSEFYCQIISESAELQRMMEKINKMYAKLKLNDMKLEKMKIGTPCCAIYEGDSMWYRAKLMSVSSNHCEVLFVDYGNTEVTQLSKVKALYPEFFSIPPQSLLCSLFNTVPESGNWSSEDINAFVEMANEKSFVAQFVRTETSGAYLVNLFDINKLQDDVLSKDFVKLGHGQLQDSNKLLVVNSLVASTSLTYLEPDVQLGSNEQVIVTWVTDAVQFYCQKKAQFAIFEAMMEKIQSHYSQQLENEGTIDRPHTGMICVAQFTKDFAWYRAKILGVEKNTVLVFYVDYGNKERLKKNKVKYISQDFTSLPVQAIKCNLQGLRDSAKNLPNSLPSLFEGETVCTFVSKQDDYFIVDLYCDGKDVAQEIARFGLATSDKKKSYNNVNISDHSKILQNTGSFQKNQLVNVIASYVESPNKFWCQLEDSVWQVDEMMTEIKSYCDTNDGCVLENPAVGDSCLAVYSKDEQWYRATVKQLLDSGRMEVTFVDYGNSEVVDCSQVKAITPDFLVLPAQAVECQLHGLPASYDKELIVKFMDLVENAIELLMKIENVGSDVLTVTLFVQSDTEAEVNVLESIFGVQPEVDKDEEKPAYLPPEVPSGEHLGYISSFKSPGDFFVQLVSQEANLEELSMQLSQKYQLDDESLLLDAVVPGIVCCARYSKDEEWYRAQITDVQGEAVIVLFVDYGNCDTTSASWLRRLDKDFLQVPPFAIPCQLHSVYPIGNTWCESAVDKLGEYADETQISITFVEPSLPAAVNVQKDGKSLKDELIGLGVATLPVSNQKEIMSSDPSMKSKDDAIAESAVTLKRDETVHERVLTESKLTARICFVQSFQKIFITAVEWVEELDVLMSCLDEVYNDSEQESAMVLNKVVDGQWCAAKYSEDGSWYRAIITGRNDSNISIKFVDYGNCETVSLEELRCLKSEFLKYPPFAVECQLQKFQPVEGKEEEIMAKLQEFCDDAVDLEFDIQLDQKPYVVQLASSSEECVSPLISEGLVSTLPNSEACQNDISVINEHDTGDSVFKVDLSYPQRNLTSTAFVVTVSFVESWDEFYVIPVDLSDELLTLMGMVKEQYESENSDSLLLNSVHVGQPCAVKYSEDDRWYRAIVNDMDGDNIFLNFIDYGYSEISSLNEIRQMTSELVNFPPFALKCNLFGFVAAAGMEDAVLAKLQSFTDDEEIVDLEVVENYGSSYSVKLLHNDDFCKKLVEEGLGEQSNTQVKEKVDALSDAIERNSEVACDQSIAHALEFPIRIFPCAKIEARVCYVETWDRFYVTATAWEEELSSLSNDLKNDYADDSSSFLDEICDGQHSVYVNESQDCYRVCIRSVDGETVTVHCIDFGNSLIVNISALKKLSSKFAGIPAFSVECRLHELLPVQGAEADISKRLQALASGKTKVEVEVLNDEIPYEVRIKTDTDFLTQLIHDGLALTELLSPERLHDLETFKDNLKIAFVDDHIDEATKYSIPNQPLSFKEISCILQQCEVDNERVVISVVPTDLMISLANFQEKLQSMYDNIPSSALTISKGDYCVAKFPVDDCWYRVQVLEKANGSVVVKSVDFGNTEVVSVDDVKKLVLEFSEVPKFIIECCMPGIRIVDGKNEAVENKMMEFDCDLIVHLCEIPTHNSADQICITKAEISNVDVIELLIKEDLIKQVFPLEEGLKVFQCDIANIDNDLTFHLIPHEFIEKRNVMQESLRSVYDSFKPAEVGEVTSSYLYAAVKDSVWYRSSICSVDDTNAVVHFVDFGTTHTLDVSDLCILYPDFCHPSAFSVKGRYQNELPVVKDLQKKISDIVQGKSVTCVVSYFEYSTDNYIMHLTVDGKDIVELLHCSLKSSDSAEPLASVGESNLENSDRYDENYVFDHGLNHAESSGDTTVSSKGLCESSAEPLISQSFEGSVGHSVDSHDIPEFDHTEVQEQDSVPFTEEGELSGSEAPDSVDSSLTEELNQRNSELCASTIDKNVEVLPDGLTKCENVILGTSDSENNSILQNITVSMDVHSLEHEECESNELDTENFEVGSDSKNHLHDLNTLEDKEDNIVDVEIMNSADCAKKGLHTDTELSEKEGASLLIRGDGEDSVLSGEVGSEMQLSGEVESEMRLSGEVESEMRLSGEVESEMQLSGEVESEMQLSGEVKSIPNEMAFLPESTHSVINQSSDEFHSPKSAEIETQNQEFLSRHRQLPLGRIDVSVLDFKIENSKILMSVIPVCLEAEFEDLQDNLQKWYSSQTEDANSEIVVGPCAVLSKDNIWCRGEILEVSNDSVTVCCWDIAFMDIIPINCVRKLDLEFCSQLPFAISCIIPVAKCCEPDAVKTKLQNQFNHKIISVEVLNTSHPVAVKLLDKENIIQELVSECLLTLEISPHSIFSGEHLVNISYIDDESGFSIYIQRVDQLNNLEQLHEKMQHEYEDREGGITVKDAASIGTYAVQNNGTWQRCNVLKRNSTALFYFIDTGECKEAAVDTLLQPLLYEFFVDPPYAYPCHVSNLPIIPEEIVSEVTLALKQVSVERKLFAKILERKEDGFYSVYLTVDKEDILQWLERLDKLNDGLKMILERSSAQCDTTFLDGNLQSETDVPTNFSSNV